VLRRWLAKKPMYMRQTHHAGDKVFVDYSGKRPHFFDPSTGERVDVELFVAAQGASNYTYVEATLTQRIEDWLGSHMRAVEFFGGVNAVYVPDQLRSAVRSPCRYEPGITRSYADWARHYGTAIVPARPGKPRGRVARWRGGRRRPVAPARPFGASASVRLAVTPFPAGSRRTGRAVLPHPALISVIMPSLSAGFVSAPRAGRGRASRREDRAGTGGTRCQASCAFSRATAGVVAACTTQASRRLYVRVLD
jgi:hypothetical protein